MPGNAPKSIGSSEGWSAKLLSLFRRKPRKYKLPTFQIVEVPASQHEQSPPWAPYQHVDDILPARFGIASKFFHCHIAGVTFPNVDGGSRLNIISACRPGDILQLFTGTLPEFPESVAVLREDGAQLGFLPNLIAHEMRGEVERWRCCFQYVTHPEDSDREAGASVCLMRLADPPRVVREWEIEALAFGASKFSCAVKEVRAVRLAGVKDSQEKIVGIAHCLHGDVLNLSNEGELGTVTTQSGVELGSLRSELVKYLAWEHKTGSAEWRALFAHPTHVGTSKTICGAEIWLYRFPLK